MLEKSGKKTTQKLHKKKQNARLSLKEKIEVCTLLGSGYSLSETAQLISKRTKKNVSRWQVRHYLDSPKWSSYIRAARKNDIANAEKIAEFSTVGRIRKYSHLLEVFEKKFYQSLQNIESENLDPESDPGTFKFFNLAASYILKILREVREEEFEALAKKSSGQEEEIEDFFAMVEQRIIISRKHRNPDRELEKVAGLL